MKVYKVVKRINDVLKSVSLFHSPQFGLVYEVGKETTAPDGYENALPFAFVSLEDAKTFVYTEGIRDAEIYIAETKETTHISNCAAFVGELHYFWRRDIARTVCVPAGTVLCDGITLLERVE